MSTSSNMSSLQSNDDPELEMLSDSEVSSKSNQKSKFVASNGLKSSSFTDKFGLIATILSGHHRGAQISFPSNRSEPIIAGSSIKSDIVLLGANVADSHVTIKPGNIFNNKVTLSSNVGPIELENGKIIHLGQQMDVVLPMKISFGDTTILLERGPGMAQVKKYIKPGFILALSLFVGIVGSILISNLSTSLGEFTEVKTKQMASANPSIETNKAKQNFTASLLKQQIKKMQLDNLLSVSEVSDGTVLVNGNLPEESMNAWRSILQWYDGQKEVAYLVNNVTSKKIDTFKLSIKSVWLDNNDNIVILSDGQMARVGETVKDGWVIDEISNNFIMVNRLGQSVKITF